MAEAASQGAWSSFAAPSLTWSFLLPQTCSWTGPLRKHPKVRGCGWPTPAWPCICPSLQPHLALGLPSWLS